MKIKKGFVQIPGLDGCYYANKKGVVLSNKKKGVSRCKTFLKPSLTDKGYLYYSFSVYGVNVRMRTHRIVAILFIPNPYNKPYINHKNGIKTDNRIKNLEWCTTIENNRHALKTGLARRAQGENAPNARFKNSDIPVIVKLHTVDKINFKDIGKIYGVGGDTIANIIRGIGYRFVPRY